MNQNLKQLDSEEAFFDQQGIGILESQDSLVVSHPFAFLAGSSVAFDYCMKLIGDVTGRRVLDYGCGSGWLAVYLAQRVAEVYGFDISSKLIEVGVKRAEANGVKDRVKLKKMVAEELDYSDDFFDVVVGISILHHIDLVRGGGRIVEDYEKRSKGCFYRATWGKCCS